MKILILGSSGQLGQCLRDQLKNTNYEVIYSSRSNIDIGNLVYTKNQILKIAPNVVINVAGYTAVDKAEKNKKVANLINYIAVSNIAKTCKQLNCLLIHMSTDYVFDGKSPLAYTELNQTNPLGVYGKTKLAGENAIKISNCKYIILRTSWVFSEHGNNFLKTMLNLSLKQNDIHVVNDQIGCPTYAQDIAKAIISILTNFKFENKNSSIYHFSGNISCTWARFSEMIFDEALNLKIIHIKPNIIPITSEEFPSLAIRPKHSTLDTGKIKSIFGIKTSDCLIGIKSSLSAIKRINLINL